MKNKRAISLIIIFTMMFSLVNINQWVVNGQETEPMRDIQDSWAKQQITDWLNKGIVAGYSDNTFRPNDYISRAEYVTLVNRIFGFKNVSEEIFTDVSSDQWFFDEVHKARYAGYISGYNDGTFKPYNHISRQEAAKIIYELLKLNDSDQDYSNVLTAFEDADDIPDWSQKYINDVVSEGYLKGYPDETVRPAKYITRAEALVMLDRVVGELINSPGVYGQDNEQRVVEGNLTINTDDVTLKNTVIKGDLYLAAGIGEGEVNLDNVTVEGRTIVSGGGENSVIIIDSSLNLVIVDKTFGKVRLLTRGNTKVVKVKVKTTVRLEEENEDSGFEEIEVNTRQSGENVELLGSFENVFINKNATVLIFANTKINHIETNGDAADSIVDILDGASVDLLILNVPTNVKGKGTIKTVFINSNGSSIDQEVEEYRLSDEVEVVIISGDAVTENPEEDTDTTNNDSGSSNNDPAPSDPEPQPATTEVEGVVLIGDELYTKFSTTQDYSNYNWTIYDSVSDAVYNAQYSGPTNYGVNIFTLYEGKVKGSEYYGVLNDDPTQYDIVMLSSTTVNEAVYSYVYYGGSTDIHVEILNKYVVTDLNNQLDGAVPLSDGDIMILYYGDQFILDAVWDGTAGEWQYGEIRPFVDYYNYHINLNLNVTDVVQHSTEPILYITDIQSKKLYAVNYETEEVSSLSFDLPPESLTYADGEIFVSLLKGEHSSYLYDQVGAVAIVDALTLTETERFDIAIDPYDIAVDGGYIYVSSGSGQWTDIKSYARDTLTEVSTNSIRQQSYIHLHPTMNKLYVIDTDTSPRDIEVYELVNGVLQNPVDSPYHGDYDMNTNMRISPDGKYIFNGAGTVFLTTDRLYDDMKYVYSLNNSFADVAFELSENKFYTTNEDRVSVYNYENFEQIGSYLTDGIPNQLFISTDQLIAVSTLNGKTVLELIDKIDMEPVTPVEQPGIDFDGRIVDTAYDANNDRLYLIDEAFHNLYTVDMVNQTIINTVKLPYRPSGITLSEDGTRLLIVNDDETNLVTEVSLSNYEITRHLNYTSEVDSRDFSTRHIYDRAGKLYVVLGDWEPTLLVFDATTFEEVVLPEPIQGVGEMAFTSDNSKFYYWYQYGWDAGFAGSDVHAYSIDGTTFTSVGQSQIGYPDFERDPLDTPVLLLEEQGWLIAKNKILNMSDLTLANELPEPIYAVDASGGVLVGKSGMYDLNTLQQIETLTLGSATEIFFDRNGILHYIEDNVLITK